MHGSQILSLGALRDGPGLAVAVAAGCSQQRHSDDNHDYDRDDDHDDIQRSSTDDFHHDIDFDLDHDVHHTASRTCHHAPLAS